MREIISDFEANAMVLGPAGSGKTSAVVLPTILAIRESKSITDLKPELVFVTKRALEERGEKVHVLNIGGVKEHLLDVSAQYNPLCIITDDFERPGGLHDISDDILEMCLQLKPEPDTVGVGSSGNEYFEIGSRDLIGFAIQTCVLIDGRNATLGDVASLLNDKEALLRHAQWACGRLEQDTENGEAVNHAIMPIEACPWNDGRHDPGSVEVYIRYYRDLAKKAANLLEANDSRTADSFLTGAQQAVERFNITTRAHKSTQKSTFRFSEQKDESAPVTVFIMADASRIGAQKQVMSLIQWCMQTEWKRHPNHRKPVYLIADEATNFKIHGLDDLLTWGRGFGIRILLIFQSLAAFRKTYGKDALATLQNETEIKLFLPGQKDPETLSLLEQSYLGQQSYVAAGRSGNVNSPDYWISGFDYREDGKPLMTVDMIRRTHKAILFIRRCRPMLVSLPPIAAIDPFRDQIDINPFHGKPFRLPVQLRLNREGTVRKTLWQRLKALFTRAPLENAERKWRHARRSSLAFTASRLAGMWWWLLVIAFLISPVGPHMLWNYQYRQYGTGGAKSYFNCHYIGSRGSIEPDVPADCPFLIFIDSRDWR